MNVYEATKDRIRHLYSTYDELICNVSMGKDSLAMFYCHYEVALELNRRVNVLFYDGEYCSHHTLELANRMKELPLVDFTHLCVATKDRNGSSAYAPFWYPWHPLEKHLWMREKPKDALTTFKGHYFEYDKDYKHPDGLDYKANSTTKAMSFQQICEAWHKLKENETGKQHITLIGLRALESLARYQAMTAKDTSEKYITISQRKAYPVYDWSAEDVWRIVIKLRDEKAPYYIGYNEEYDMANKGKEYGKFHQQRVGTPFAEESLRGVDMIRLEYPELWKKMLKRVEGVATAWRYCNTQLYSIGDVTIPEGISYKDFCSLLLKRLNPNLRKKTQKQINTCVTTHFGKTDNPIPDEEAHPLTGCSWKFLVKLCIKGDFRGRVAQKMLPSAVNAQKKLKLTRDQTVLRYGNAKYKNKYFNEIRNKKSTRKQGSMGKSKHAKSE